MLARSLLKGISLSSLNPCGVLMTLANPLRRAGLKTLASALVGLVVGVVLVFLVERLPFRRSKRESVAHQN